MKIAASGTLSHGQPGTDRAMLTFPTVTVLDDGSLLATCRAGTTKDSADEHIEFLRSSGGGESWSAPWRPLESPRIDGRSGSLKICYLTRLAPNHFLAAAMWVDRTTHLGKPLFNEETEGCLPMAILLADSTDGGASWSEWRIVPMPEEIGPPSLTCPILRLADGTLAMSIETNKQYHDRSPWMQKALFFHSSDQGKTWGEPVVAGEDPTGRIFNWDMRCGVAPDGRVASFAWTYDSQTARYLNIHRRVSQDQGRSWSGPEDLGFADQAGCPAILPDGRVVLVWVDRFRTHSIRARVAANIAADFDPASEVVLYTHAQAVAQDESTGGLLAEMGLWSFGLPYAVVLPDSDILVAWYAGTAQAMDIHWARLSL